MLKIYLDMDGVITDFDKQFVKIWEDTHALIDRRDLYTVAVLEHEIFKHLEFMSNAKQLLYGVADLASQYNALIEILTSVGTESPEVGEAARLQKIAWLEQNHILYPRNFVKSKPQKAQYSSPSAILIDDRQGCIDPFKAKGGGGILYKDSQWTGALLQLERWLDHGS